MAIRILLQKACSDSTIPSPQQLKTWAKAAVILHRNEAELTIRIVNKAEIHALNRQYRHKDKPTNVLSFPFEAPPGIQLPLLGDIIICAEVVAEEAKDQHKQLTDHWAHMVVHGTLHLLGYDHIESADAEKMESLEAQILEKFNVSNPYGD
jgi:probable rRNA maturation factor